MHRWRVSRTTPVWLQNIRREILGERDLDPDALKDLFLRSLDPLKDYIRSLDTAQFRVIQVMKESQVEVYRRWNESCKLRRAYLDATGNILRKLAEMITETQTMLSIKSFLEFVKSIIENRFGTAQLFHEIVTDKSFANIGAISMAFNSMTLTKNMKVCWTIASEPNPKKQKRQIRNLTVIKPV